MCIPIIIDIDITIPAPLELITPVLKAAIKCIDTNQIQYLHLSITRHAVHALKYPQAIIASIQDRFSLRSRASSSSSGKQHFVRHRRGICSPSHQRPPSAKPVVRPDARPRQCLGQSIDTGELTPPLADRYVEACVTHRALLAGFVDS